MANAPGRLGGKALTAELRKLAVSLHTTDSEGNPISKEQALSDLIWKMALGWEEITKDENGNLIRKIHPAVAWAMQFLFERIEGKAPQSTTENEGSMKAATKVRQLAKDRINAMTVKTAIGGPPKRVKKLV